MIPPHLMNSPITINRLTHTKDLQGGATRAFASSSTTVGRIEPISESERVVGSREQAQATHMAYFQPGTDVQYGDQLVTASPGSLTVYVIGVEANVAGMSHHMEVPCNNVQLES